mmetsp:Transcript_39054/g.97770  ORF Transcript_39054/g.97770 Transcript_39054/m.97770 type:complete len:169 (+) Transcript_39054:97-603(+)
MRLLVLAASLLAAVDGFTSPAMPMRLAGRGKVGLSTLRAAEVKYGELQHCGVLVDDVATGVAFYTKVLGMKDVSELRPNLPYEGAFLECGANQIHLMKLPDPDPREGRPEHGGRDRHLAVTVGNLDPLAENLKKNDVVYTMSKSGRRALFCRDPYMNAIEFVEDTNVG